MRDREAVDSNTRRKRMMVMIAKMRKKKTFNSSASILSQYSRLSEKRIAKFREKRIFEIFSSTFELRFFNLVGSIFLTSFLCFLLFREILKTFCHLMAKSLLGC
jgi:hypothetical protein